jgi:hypothetical protein
MRFAGSGIDFTPQGSGVTTGSYSGAAGVVDIADSFGAQREKAPRYDELSATAMQANSAEKRAAMEAEANVMAAGIQSIGQAKASQMTAEASMKAAEKQAGASKMGSVLGAVGSIGGALIGLSDETTKYDVKRIDSALETLRNLKPVTFFYKEEFSTSPERMHHGFIAQEFQKVLPDATYYDESIEKLAIDTGDIIGLLVRANQELETRITRLEATKALAGVN